MEQQTVRRLTVNEDIDGENYVERTYFAGVMRHEIEHGTQREVGHLNDAPRLCISASLRPSLAIAVCITRHLTQLLRLAAPQVQAAHGEQQCPERPRVNGDMSASRHL